MRYGFQGSFSFLAAAAAFAFLLPACGSSDDSSSGDGDSYLSKDARDELSTIDALKYEGTAVIESEEDSTDGYKKVTFDPESGPKCLYGDKFTAFYKDNGSDKTMILMNGGGACWTSLCAATSTAAVAPTPIGPATDKAGEYFSDWNVVIASYCDGSVFSGDNDYVQPEDGKTRYHHGVQNLAATLDITTTHFGDSKQVMIGGFSAGGYGTLPGMVATRLLFPKADLFAVDDSGPGLQNLANPEGIQERLTEWRFDKTIPKSCTDCDGGHGQLTPIFSWMLERDSNIKVALLSYFEDNIIGDFFLGLQGPAYKALLTTESAKVQSKYPDRFVRYMRPGAKHVVSAEWANVTADGVHESDWVRAMAQGNDTVWKDIQATGD